MSELSHLDDAGRARMVDVSLKPVTARTAAAKGRLVCAAETLRLAAEGRTPKGAVVATAELAGVMAAKRTADLIPLCHPLPLSGIDVRITAGEGGFDIAASVRTTARTGVEMEALTAVSVAALTLYDMLKAVDKAMRIEGIEVVEKIGGKLDFAK